MAILLIASIALLIGAIGYELLELYLRPVRQEGDEQTSEWAQRIEIISISFF